MRFGRDTWLELSGSDGNIVSDVSCACGGRGKLARR